MMQMLSFSFNGIRKDYVHMLRGRKRPPWPSLTRNILTVPGRPGGYLQGTEIQPRIIEIPIVIEGQNIGDLQKLKEDLASWLVTDEPKELVFDDEPDRTYYAVVDETIDFDEIAYLGQGTIRFLCPDPYKYGPLRTQTINVPPASFSRSSVAYLSDGTQVSANQPRFEQGGVLVEEGTVNLLTANQASVETDLSGIVANYPSDVTITRDTTVSWHGNASAKISCSTSTNYRGIRIGPFSLTSGKTYTFSAYVRGLNGGEKIRLAVARTGPWLSYTSTITLTTNFQRVTLTWACDTTGSHYLEIGQFENTAPITFYYDGGQVEEKPYATSFVDGTRQSDRITLPADGVLNPLSGTIEFWAYVDAQVRETSKIRRFFSHFNGSGNANRITVQHNLNYPQWVFTIADNAGNAHSLSPADSLTPDGWHHFAMVWDSSRFAAFIDGVKRGEILNPTYLPQSLASTFDIGHSAALYQPNTLIGPFRISRIARSDAEILDAYQNGFTVDEYTTAYLDFENNLEVQTPTIVTNEGTAETYPTFTAYVKQPITFLDIISPDSYMRVGQPYATDQTPVDGDVRVLNDNMSTLTGWGSASAIDGGVIQGSFQVVSETFRVQSYGPSYNGWAGPALKKSVPSPIQDFQVKALIDITSSSNGVGRIEIYGLDAANNFVFRMGIGDFSAKSKDVKAYWELGPSTDTIFTTYGKKKGMLNDYYGILVIQRKGNKWTFYTARRTSAAPVANYVDYVQSTYVDTKNKYTGQLAQIQIHIGTHLSYGPISHMSINHLEVFELRNPAADQIPYIAYPDDVLQFDHKNAVIYRNGEPIMWAKDFGASFFALKPGTTELSVNPSDAAVVTIDYRPRYK
ncbi:distal tail protein Dit [Caldibacillus debilis]|uniref:Putative phage tail component, N-terminal domain n=1 Tax=Caldibacillus debilis GB1 TaxID=1339248 RepID=A0A420VJY8_9BACI|nr:distal tail protein Dit [Caldibacillus debilis]RKO63663.1 putative phage tail component, N-terminal domain [Caldibacillus debilis GB1]